MAGVWERAGAPCKAIVWHDGSEAKLEAAVEGAQTRPRVPKGDGQDGVNDDCTQEANEAWEQAGRQIRPEGLHLVLHANEPNILSEIA